jgi:asparagine synthase (glutamine-hydrolysing)
MCGFFGIVVTDRSGPIDQPRFESALGQLNHRGPDAKICRRIDNRTMLGHTRLSIIDLSEASNQPLSFDDRYWMVFNGEIFNYVELRAELVTHGVCFQTSGDSEVLLKSYIHWGEDCVNRFNGMWAFAIYDTREQTLFCSRDRFGIKPFHYALDEGVFYFASEIKAIIDYAPALAVPDYNVISNFCQFSVGAQQPDTWFAKIKRLQPGHTMVLRDSQHTTRRYWHYPAAVNYSLSFEDATAEYTRLFKDAVRIRMRSDVPLGITLSAGIDSNSIVYAMQDADPSPHHCFTARFLPEEGLLGDKSIYARSDIKIDESVTARRVADELKLNSHVVDTDYSDFVARVSTIVWHLESGNSSPAVIPLMQLLKKAREHVTVIMDGQGADELLGGYVINLLWESVFDLLREGKIKEAVTSMREFSKTYRLSYGALMSLRGLSNNLHWISAIQQRLFGISDILGPALCDYTRVKDFPDLPEAFPESFVASRLRTQHSGGLVNLLHYGDAISMANSLEARMPFMDYRLVDFVWSLPGNFKVRMGIGKYIHRNAMRGLVPDWILDEKNKFGFNSPIANQFRKSFPDGESPIDVLLSSRCLSRGIFDKSGLEKLIKVHCSGKRDHGPLLYRLLCTELWFERFIDERPSKNGM